MPVALSVAVPETFGALLEGSGVAVHRVLEERNALRQLQSLAAPVDVLLVGPVPNPVVLVQRLNTHQRDAAVVLLTTEDDYERVAGALATAPFVGPDPRCLPLGRPAAELLAEVRRAAEGTVRRRSYREAAHAMSLKLASAPVMEAQPLAFLDRIFELAPVGILGIDESRTVVIANPRAQEILGASVEPRLGTRLDELLDRPAYEALDAVLSRAAREGAGPHARTTLARTTARGERLLEIVAAPIVHPGGKRVFLALMEDVTERATADRERMALIQQLDAAVRTRDEFLAVASHELKTPLTALKLQLGMLARAPPGTHEKAAGRVTAAVRQVDNLQALVDRLLDVGRLATGKFTLEPRELDLAELVRDVTERMRELLVQAGCTLSLDVRGPVIGRWDPSRLEQVLVNLLSNAAKYGAGTSVDVSVRREGATAVVGVRDRGIGMNPADVPNLFGRFSRGVSDRHYGGLGLGLYIARQIVIASGGDIRVTTAPGKGALFELVLPLEAAAGLSSTG